MFFTLVSWAQKQQQNVRAVILSQCLCRLQAASGEVTHRAPWRWVPIGCCSSTRGFGKNHPRLQPAHTSPLHARAWPWSDSPVVFTALREPDISFQGRGGELRAPENVKEQMEMVVCPEEVPTLQEITVNGTQNK